MSAARAKFTDRFRRLVESEAHHRLTVASLCALIAFGIFSRFSRWPLSLIAAWDVFAVCSLVLAWLGMLFTDAKTRVREAHLQDSHRAAICCCVVFAALAGLLGAGTLLGTAKALPAGEGGGYVALAALTVISSWLLVHTTLALHYAHIFYCPCESGGPHEHGAGVVFPGEKKPDFLDFAYFSFVVGMTFQVSDVQVTSRRMRRAVLLHGLLSFVFNTVIVAFSINLAATLL